MFLHAVRSFWSFNIQLAFFCVIKPLLVIFLGASFHDFDSPMSFWDDKLKYLNDLWCAVYVFFFANIIYIYFYSFNKVFFFGFAFISFLQPPQTKILQFYQGNTFFFIVYNFCCFCIVLCAYREKHIHHLYSGRRNQK